MIYSMWILAEYCFVLYIALKYNKQKIYYYYKFSMWPVRYYVYKVVKTYYMTQMHFAMNRFLIGLVK